jgi:tetratricopeptide (TPR) repeat protein
VAAATAFVCSSATPMIPLPNVIARDAARRPLKRIPVLFVPCVSSGVRLNLAVAYQEVGRFDESLLLLRECKEIFREYVDARLAILAAYTEGVCLQRLRKFREAREPYLLLLASTDDIESETLASLHQSIGHCCVELGDFEAAEANLTKGIRLHHDLGQPLQAQGSSDSAGSTFRKGITPASSITSGRCDANSSASRYPRKRPLWPRDRPDALTSRPQRGSRESGAEDRP